MSQASQQKPSVAAADALAARVLVVCESLRPLARHSVGSQLCRAAVSAACNLVEACSRRSAKERLRFVEIADGSLREAGYLIGLAGRARLFAASEIATLTALHTTATVKLRTRRAGAARTASRHGRRARRTRRRVTSAAIPTQTPPVDTCSLSN